MQNKAGGLVTLKGEYTMGRFSVPIEDVVDLLGLEREPRYDRMGAVSFNVRCPFCGDDRYHMNINTDKNVYRCFKCGDGGGGVLDLYGRVALGISQERSNGGFIYKSLIDALGKTDVKIEHKRPANTVESAAILPASDTDLDKAYSALLSFGPLRLTKKHYDNLIARGLDDETITKNGYRSLMDCQWVWQRKYDKIRKIYYTSGINEYCNSNSILRDMDVNRRIAGIVVAMYLHNLGINMDGVPGFFKVPMTAGKYSGKSLWMFRLSYGMFVPTRNREGQIVGMQMRTDWGNLRYVTVSSNGLLNGVTERISRVHFTLDHPEINSDTKVYLTEGPLKADTAYNLLKKRGEDAVFIAIQGVQNTKELPDVLLALKKQGVTKIYDAFDMDKLTNKNVAMGLKKIYQMMKFYNVRMIPVYWDEVFAKDKLTELLDIAAKNSVQIENIENKNIFEKLAVISRRLESQGIVHSILTDNKGNQKKHYWSDETKGIDDVLKHDEKLIG